MKVTISDFLMDVYPVTNQEFLQFVKENPKWRKSALKKYLQMQVILELEIRYLIRKKQSIKAPITKY